MKNIEHVVHLMLENRSLDNVLGWLYDADKPAHFLPLGSKEVYDGLQTPGDHSNSYEDHEFPAQRGTTGATGFQGVAPQPLRVPGFDPGEEYDHVNQQLFGSPHHPTTRNPAMEGNFSRSNATAPAVATARMRSSSGRNSSTKPETCAGLRRSATFGIHLRRFRATPGTAARSAVSSASPSPRARGSPPPGSPPLRRRA